MKVWRASSETRALAFAPSPAAEGGVGKDSKEPSPRANMSISSPKSEARFPNKGGLNAPPVAAEMPSKRALGIGVCGIRPRSGEAFVDATVFAVALPACAGAYAPVNLTIRQGFALGLVEFVSVCDLDTARLADLAVCLTHSCPKPSGNPTSYII